jgi:flagellar basal body rod protein FlgC
MDIMGIALGGMQAAERSLDTTARHVAGATAGSAPDTTDLSADAVALLEAKKAFAANAQAARSADEMQQQVLDLLA